MKGKHLLVVSGPMGTGHFQAGAALRETAKVTHPDLKVTHIDLKRLMGNGLRFYFTVFYPWILRWMPWAWRWIYTMSNVPDRYAPIAFRIINPRRHRTAARLLRVIRNLKPDYIVCTHFFAAEIVGEAKAAGEITVPVGSVITDFSLHWNYIRPGVDRFFVPDHDMALITHVCGVPLERITVSGCPVKPVFAKHYNDAEIAELSDAAGVPREGDYVLVTMGGESIGRVEEVSRFLLDKFPHIRVMAACGNNKRLYSRMRELTDIYGERLLPLNYSNHFYRFMLRCFAVVTKPGGITVSECCTLRKPMIIVDPIPGHEEKNALYISTHGIAVLPGHLCGLAYLDLRPGADWIRVVLENQKHHSSARSGEIILETMFALGKERP